MKKPNYLINLYKSRRELVILEWAYLLIAVISVFIAGIFALLDQSVGVAILIVPLVAIVAFSMNLLSWAVVKLLLENIFPELKGIGKELSLTPDKKSEKKSK